MKAKIRRAFDRFTHGFMCGFVGTSGGCGTYCSTAVQLYNNKLRDV